jgi:hypothetical protein
MGSPGNILIRRIIVIGAGLLSSTVLAASSTAVAHASVKAIASSTSQTLTSTIHLGNGPAGSPLETSPLEDGMGAFGTDGRLRFMWTYAPTSGRSQQHLTSVGTSSGWHTFSAPDDYTGIPVALPNGRTLLVSGQHALTLSPQGQVLHTFHYRGSQDTGLFQAGSNAANAGVSTLPSGEVLACSGSDVLLFSASGTRLDD